MKVILTQDVNKLGESGTIQNVKDGYARNFLIPQGLAQMATPGTIKQVEQRQVAEGRRVAKLEDELRELGTRIEAAHITIQARVGEQGRLYGSVTASDIASRLSEEMGEEIDRRKVELDQPIRQVGEFEVPVRLVGRLIPLATVTVFDPDAPIVVEEEVEEVEEVDVIVAETEQLLDAEDDEVTEDDATDIEGKTELVAEESID